VKRSSNGERVGDFTDRGAPPSRQASSPRPGDPPRNGPGSLTIEVPCRGNGSGTVPSGFFSALEDETIYTHAFNRGPETRAPGTLSGPAVLHDKLCRRISPDLAENSPEAPR
jgi:hypothetical protein